MKKFNQGIILSSLGSFWWGVIGVIYFRSLSFVGPLELVIHRCLWTTIFLLITTFFLFKWQKFLIILKSSKKIFILFLSSILILTNWSVWIYAVSTNQIINASFGYFIMPIMSVFFGYLFFKEKLNFKIILSIILVLCSIFYMLCEFKTIPWIGLKNFSGGETGSRTQERVAPLPVFKTGAFNRSAISPCRSFYN